MFKDFGRKSPPFSCTFQIGRMHLQSAARTRENFCVLPKPCNTAPSGRYRGIVPIFLGIYASLNTRAGTFSCFQSQNHIHAVFRGVSPHRIINDFPYIGYIEAIACYFWCLRRQKCEYYIETENQERREEHRVWQKLCLFPIKKAVSEKPLPALTFPRPLQTREKGFL